MTFWEDLMTVPHELRFVDVDGVRTRVLHAGSGTPLILLHGISGHLETYIPVMEALSAEFDVHAIDMLAHGFTGKPGGDSAGWRRTLSAIWTRSVPRRLTSWASRRAAGRLRSSPLSIPNGLRG